MRSTKAPNGILSKDPVSAGLALRSPIKSGVNAIGSLSFVTMGPNAETPANPAKKARVVQTRAGFLLDLARQTSCMESLFQSFKLI
jgi:hypothetical protein